MNAVRMAVLPRGATALAEEHSLAGIGAVVLATVKVDGAAAVASADGVVQGEENVVGDGVVVEVAWARAKVPLRRLVRRRPLLVAMLKCFKFGLFCSSAFFPRELSKAFIGHS